MSRDSWGPDSGRVSFPPESKTNPLKQSLALMKKLEAKLEQLREPIAIVGMACRFPGGGSSPARFWDVLARGVDAVQDVTTRWPDAPPDGLAGHPGEKWAALLPSVDQFDAGFFEIAPREARSLDPQHRLVLEVTWEALENAGIAAESLKGTETGAFIGVCFHDYERRVDAQPPSEMDAYCLTGNLPAMAAGRLSYVFGFQGPTMSIDTTCSSSLVAVHLAAASLRTGESKVAVAGGTNLILGPEMTAGFARTQALSGSGRCRAFDAQGDGYVRGEGCGILVLKRLSDAQRDGDRIWALIVGSAVNQDGRSNGLTAPNVLAQKAVIRRALDSAHLSPTDVEYVEAHGTGTPLGDPIEFEGLKAVYGQPRPDGATCAVGSVKTNIGHLEGAAGVAGLMKVVLALQNETIPRHLHLRTLNPRIDLAGTSLRIAQQPIPWRRSERPRRGGVSSFGMSGTNAHVIIEEAPAPEFVAPAPERSAELFVVSARTPAALQDLARELSEHVKRRDDQTLGATAYTLAAGRSHHEERLAIVAGTREALVEALAQAGAGEVPVGATRGVRPPSRRKVAWLFTGQGAQTAGMGRQLAAEWPAFKEALVRATDAIDRYLDVPLRQIMWAEGDKAKLLDETGYTQPALFALEVALAALWQSWGVEPDMLLGHSIGEIVAAHVAGVMSLEDAARLVVARGRLMQALPAGGAMVAIEAPEDDVRAAMQPYGAEVSIAGVNGPRSVVVSGSEREVTAVAEGFSSRGVRTKKLVVSHAFHSGRMDPMLDEFRQVAQSVAFGPPRIPIVSNVTGEIAGEEIRTPEYWVRQVRSAVRFADGVATLHKNGIQAYVELGPKATLVGLVPSCLPESAQEAILLSSLKAQRPETSAILAALAGWYAHGGAKMTWPGVFPGHRARVDLPTYPWQRQRYWVEEAAGKLGASGIASAGTAGRSPLAGIGIEVPSVGRHHVVRVGVKQHPWLADHVIYGDVIAPAALYMAVMLATAAECWPDQPLEVTDLEFTRPLIFSADKDIDLHVVLTSPEGSHATSYTVEIATPLAGEDGTTWTTHARGRIAPTAARPQLQVEPAPTGDATKTLTKETFFDAFARRGGTFGSRWRWLTGAVVAETKAWGEIACADGLEPVHPILLDNTLLTSLVPVLRDEPAPGELLRIPFAVRSVRLWSPPSGLVRTASALRAYDDDKTLSEVALYNEEGDVLLEMDGLVTRAAPREAPRAPERGVLADALYRVDWADAAIQEGAPAPRPGRWLVVCERDAADVRRELEAKGVACDVVAPDEAAAILERGDPVSTILCLWDEGGSADDPAAATERLAVSALKVTHAALRRASSGLRMWWMTRGAQVVHAGEAPSCAAAAVWGLGRTVMLEAPDLVCTLVDLPNDEPLVQAAMREVSIADDEQQVAWRRGKRHVARLVKAQAGTAPRSLRLDGTFVITGGLGALGLRIARLLAERGAAHVVLVGRRGAETPGAADAIAELSALGTRLSVARADVADPAELAEVLRAIPAELPLRGIVHAAGVIDDGVLVDQAPERFARVLAPKVRGAWNLHTLTKDVDLDLFVLFSSSTATLGAAGQGAYPAGNAFLDALAHYRRAHGLRAQSLGWGPWAGVGLASALDAANRARFARQGVKMLRPEQGALLFEQAVVKQDDAHLVLMLVDPKVATENAASSSIWRALAPRAAVEPRGGWAQKMAAMPEPRRLEAATDLVRNEVARVLALGRVDDVRPERALREFGLDSLMAVELRNVLARSTGLTLPATLAYDHPTPAAIGKFLISKVATAAMSISMRPPSASMRPPTASMRPASPSMAPSADRAMADAIAVVGIGCRFPGGVHDPESFWRMLAAGVDGITEVPRERWDVDTYYDPDPDAAGKMTTRWGGWLEGIERFDPGFFGISPGEAKSIDPQERLLLETSWEALERAGIAPEQLAGSATGVYVGLCGSEYQARVLRNTADIDAYSYLGTAHSAMVGRLSYWLGLKGPNIALDTACSSSLVAVHLACQAIRARECTLALAGGANVLLDPEMTVYFSRLRAMSPTGRCHAFSADADGYVRAEGAGMVVLERLADAQRNKHPILAIIRGTAVNQDGRSNGLTAPNGPSQEAVIREALERDRLEPKSIDYLECHGTGTPLGDPIEVQAAAAALGQGRDRAAPLVLSSVKSNIGHTEGAAGVAGLIKAVLALRHAQIPKSLHCGALNPHIPWSELPVRVATETLDWPRRATPRRAAVSSFGFSGTNAHVVLEEAPAAPAAPAVIAPSPSAELFVLSARTPAALEELARDLSEHVKRHGDQALGATAYTLAAGRSHHEERLAIVAGTREALAEALAQAGAGEVPAGAARGVKPPSRRKVAWLFTGQGAQTAGMGRQLAAEWPVFREALARATDAVDKHLDVPLRQIMWAEGDKAKLLDETGYTQPALFALEVALAALWQSWGVEPDMLLGHSIGEIVAAHVAGVMSLEDAARLVVARGRLMQALPAGGAMVAIEAPEGEVRAAMQPYGAEVSIAGVNGPRSVVVSGSEREVAAVAESFSSRGVRTKKLVVSHAFHSGRMDPMLDAFRKVAQSVTFAPPRIPIVSNVTGEIAGDEVRTPEYWVRQVRSAVRFADGVATLHKNGIQAYVELGPKATLVGLVPSCLPESAQEAILLSSLKAQRPETSAILAALGGWYAQGGGRVEWSAVFPTAPARVQLPTYPWQRQRHWVDDARNNPAASLGTAGRSPLAGAGIEVPNLGRHHVLRVGLRHQPYVADHVIHDQVLVPGVMYVAMMLSIGAEVWPGQALELTDVDFVAPLPLDRDEEVDLHAVLTTERDRAGYAVQLATPRRGGTGWTTHVRARIAPTQARPSLGLRPDAMEAQATKTLDTHGFFEAFAPWGVKVGPGWRWLTRAAVGPTTCVAEIPRVEATEPIHTIVLDNAIVSSQAYVLNAGPREGELFRIPFGIRSVIWWGKPSNVMRVAAVQRTHDAQSTVADLTLLNEAGDAVLEMRGLVTRPAAPAALQHQSKRAAALQSLYRLEWPVAPDAAKGLRPGRWLVVCEQGRDDLRKALDAKGVACEVVAPGELAGALKRGAFSTIVAVWDGERGAEPDRAAEELTSSALRVVQAALHGAGGTRMWWFTRAAVAVEPSEAPACDAAALWGLGRTVMQEAPDLGFTLVDVAVGNEIADAILRELSIGDDEQQVAWRAGRRHVARLTRAAPVEAPRRRLRTDGTYLVTGGLGALGVEVARWLAKRGARHIVLVGRRGRETPGASEAVAELGALGAHVTVVAADVAKRDAVADVLRAIPAEHPLRGVVHAAVVLDDGVLGEQTPERFARVLGAKAGGAWNLHTLTQGADLDLFVLFSSSAATTGSAGQGPYSAANAFLDALAQHRRARGLPAQSLAWGPWADSGLASALGDANRARFARQGVRMLTSGEGMALFEHATIARDDANLVIVGLDLPAREKAFAGAVPSLWRALIVPAPTPATSSAPSLVQELAALPPARRLDALVARVCGEVARVLGLASAAGVRPDRRITDLGVDSLMAVELRNSLGKQVGAKLRATLAFDHPTPLAIATHLMNDVIKIAAPQDGPAQAAAVPPPTPTDPSMSDIAVLDEIERLEVQIAAFEGARHEEVAAEASARLYALAAKLDAMGPRSERVAVSGARPTEATTKDLLSAVDEELLSWTEK